MSNYCPLCESKAAEVERLKLSRDGEYNHYLKERARTQKLEAEVERLKIAIKKYEVFDQPNPYGERK